MPTHTRAQALDQLAILAEEIADLHVQLSEVLQAEHRARVTSWFNTDAQYVTERDRIAEYNSLNLSLDVMRLTGDLRAAEARRDYYQMVVHWGPGVTS